MRRRDNILMFFVCLVPIGGGIALAVASLLAADGRSFPILLSLTLYAGGLVCFLTAILTGPTGKNGEEPESDAPRRGRRLRIGLGVLLMVAGAALWVVLRLA